MVGRQLASLFEPEGGQLIEHLSFERDAAEYHVERADAIAHHDGALTILHVAVAHLADVPLAEPLEVGAVECPAAEIANQSDVDAHGALPSFD